MSDEYTVTITVDRSESEGMGFASATETDRSVSVQADIGQKAAEVEHEPDSDVDDAVESFLNELGIDEIEL